MAIFGMETTTPALSTASFQRANSLLVRGRFVCMSDNYCSHGAVSPRRSQPSDHLDTARRLQLDLCAHWQTRASTGFLISATLNQRSQRPQNLHHRRTATQIVEESIPK